MTIWMNYLGKKVTNDYLDGMTTAVFGEKKVTFWENPIFLRYTYGYRNLVPIVRGEPYK